MSRSFLSATATTFLLLTLCISVAAQSNEQKRQQTIAFTVAMPKPHTHLLDVEIHIKRESGDWPTEDIFVMPVWTPGSYLVREFARHVQDFDARNATGAALDWEKVNKNSWKVRTAGIIEYRVTYRVYANELTARTNHLNSDHAFWNNAALLMYLDGYLNSPATVKILAPEPWRIATSLSLVAGQKNTFRAENFDMLYDAPIEVGNFKTVSFEIKGVQHRIVIHGEGNHDPERLSTDVSKIVTTQIELMGGEIPYSNYIFFLHLHPAMGGDGLEHLNSTSLRFPRFGFRPESRYRGFLTLVAHEFFHLWNVKRIRPDVLGPFNYNEENYTKLLWVAEGITSYYENLTLVRAGLISDRDFLSMFASQAESLQNRPGRLVMSVEEASFDAWIKFYRQDENAVNSQVDYYDKGAILGLLLDLHIRKSSGGTKSLDDVMRYLYTEFYKKNRNYTPEDFQKASELMAGQSLEPFFANYVRGREELNYNEALAAAGLRLDTTGASRGTKPEEQAYLGAELTQQGDRLIVRRVLAGGPAYEQGLNVGDQIVALNNMRVTRDFFYARLAEKKPSDPISLTIFRADDLSTLLIRLGGRVSAPYAIMALSSPSNLQKQTYQAWLGVPQFMSAQRN